tara:strand:+ start:767 stop:1831 length:1065 start_codon:yes stop_codon:yes gene_type:complete
MRLSDNLLKDPSRAGEFVKHGKNYVYIPDGVDTRIVSTKNGIEQECRRMLKKFDFTSQNEMHVAIKSWDELIDKENHQMSYYRDIWSQHAWKATGKDKTYRVYSRYDRDSSWAFGNNKESNHADKVDKLLRDGRATKKVQRIIKKTIRDIKLEGIDTMLTERFESVKRKRVWSDDGSELDIDRVMCGDPNHWVKSKRNGKKRVIRIGVNVSASGGNKEDVFAKNVALAYLASEQLETLGYGVEIMAIDSTYSQSNNNLSRYSSDENATTFPLKRSTEPTDINRIGSIGLPSLLRYYGFRVASILFRQSNGICRPTSTEMQGFLNIDVLIQTAWKESTSEQATRIIKNISNIIEG